MPFGTMSRRQLGRWQCWALYGALWRSESIRRLANPQGSVSASQARVVIIDRRGIDPFRDSRPTGLNRPLGGCKQAVFGCLIVRQLGCLYHLRTTVGSYGATSCVSSGLFESSPSADCPRSPEKIRGYFLDGAQCGALSGKQGRSRPR